MSVIRVIYQGETFPVKVFTFPGGEAHVKVTGLTDKQYDGHGGTSHTSKEATVVCRMQEPGSFMEVLLVADVMQRYLEKIKTGSKTSLTLKVPYLPYARQDRIIETDEPFSLKVFLETVQRYFSHLETYDVHNLGATQGSWLGIEETSQLDIIKGYDGLVDWIRTSRPVIVAPDKGAFHKASEVSRELGLPLISGSKKRAAAGQVVAMSLDSADFCAGKNVLIVDDICDGGRTFTDLANLLRFHSPKSVALYVTHGLFSKGYDVFDGLIDRIYTTDTFIPKEYPLPGQIPVFIHKLVGA